MALPYAELPQGPTKRVMCLFSTDTANHHSMQSALCQASGSKALPCLSDATFCGKSPWAWACSCRV